MGVESKENKLFLQALKAALEDKKVQWEREIAPEEWNMLFQTAREHHVLPMIYEAVYTCAAARSLSPELSLQMKRKTIQTVTMQTLKTDEFLKLYRHLEEREIHPLVVKGIVCRSLYPNPDYRISGDEDILIPEAVFQKSHEAMLEFGMQQAEPGQDVQSVYEVPYHRPGSLIYIEAHKYLFPPDSEAYGELNGFFEGVWERKNEIVIQGTRIWTLNSTDHLLYLICHAFKHFLHSGFGIRQVCDIILFANEYGREVDWQLLLKHCREIRAEKFTAALFRIGWKYLTFDMEKACYPQEWQEMIVDEKMMLEDLLGGGVYGGATLSRKHSSNMTLHAVSAHKKGRKERFSLLTTVFPSAKSLEGRYTYLKKHPYLLPRAWAERLLKYGKETKQTSDNQAADAMKIGSQRIELLKQYGIIK